MKSLYSQMKEYYSEEDYWRLMEFSVYHSWIGYIIANREGKYLYTNQTYEKITGISPGEMVGSSVEVARGTTIMSEYSSVPLVLKEKKEIITEQKLRDRSVLVRGTPYFDKDGQVDYVLCQLFNIDKLNRFYSEASKTSRKGWTHFKKVETKANEVREGSVDYIIYKSASMQTLMEQAKLVAASDATVLLLGESGTGKELVAKFIHQSSMRNNEPFIQINCSAIPENLLEAEFFGYEAGSFTGGSSEGKKGLLEFADNGTVLLDEIGEMPYHMQAKLLRLLQEKEIMRIGGSEPIKLNVRFIASTNADIPTLIKEKRFRADLYYRLSTVPIKIPPLRERREDIPLLIDYFLNEMNQIYHTYKKAKKSLSDKLMELPLSGNVRELRNIIERLSIMTLSVELGEEDLSGLYFDEEENEPLAAKESDDWEGKSLADIMESYEKRVLSFFKEVYPKKSDIASALNVYPSTIVRKLQKYGL